MITRVLILLLVGWGICTAFFYLEPVPFQIPDNWPKPVYDFEANPLTNEKIDLGRNLFYDPILSRDNKVSCANCHNPYNAFTHVDHALSHGIEDKIGNRNSPALMNLAWADKFMWDGAIRHLDAQALAPISNPLEMDENIAHIVQKLQQTVLYPRLFEKAYGDSMITGEHVLKAIGQFMVSLVSAESKYDSVMRGQSAFTEQEQKGYVLFKQYCSSCHTEPLFTNYAYENNGLTPDKELKDYGRVRISQNPEDSFKFKVPTLRNIEYSYPYMHDGRFKKLSEVMKYYTQGAKNPKISSKLAQTLPLSSNDRVDIIAFLYTLTDRKFLLNPKHGFLRK
jgi:cytochrome c peroxidase